jgi:hypothetical protein
MTLAEVVILVVLSLNVLLTVLNGIMSVRNNELLSDIRDSMNRNTTPIPE